MLSRAGFLSRELFGIFRCEVARELRRGAMGVAAGEGRNEGVFDAILEPEGSPEGCRASNRTKGVEYVKCEMQVRVKK